MQTSKGKSIKSLVERIVQRRVPVAKVLSSSQPRLPVTGVPANEYVLRRVVSRRVELRRVELTGVELKCVEFTSVCTPVCNSASPVQSHPRLMLAHVFACLQAAAAKSKVSRLLGRTARPASKSSSSVGSGVSRLLPSVSERLSVSQSVSASASVNGLVARSRLH
jgi:hypothetical protein